VKDSFYEELEHVFDKHVAISSPECRSKSGHKKRLIENVSQLKHLEITLTNQNLIQEEIKRRLNSGKACYHSVQNLLFSSVKKLEN
jgi:hypothetical protein